MIQAGLTDSLSIRAYFSPLGRMRMLGGDPALDFANTLHWRDGKHVDFIPTYQSLVEWSLPAGLLAQAEVPSLLKTAARYSAAAEMTHLAAINLREVWRDRLAENIHFGEAGQADLRLRTYLSCMIGDAGLQLVDNDVCEEAAPILLLPLRRVALAITSLELIPVDRRVGRCEGDPCGGYFLDSSRSKPRRWCSMDTCGNRAKVRGFRGRIRAEEVVSSVD